MALYRQLFAHIPNDIEKEVAYSTRNVGCTFHCHMKTTSSDRSRIKIKSLLKPKISKKYTYLLGCQASLEGDTRPIRCEAEGTLKWQFTIATKRSICET